MPRSPSRIILPSLMSALVCFLLAAPTARACTLWAAAGDAVQGGGAIIVKNRDWTPGESQRIEIFRPAGGYAYVALMATREAQKSTGVQVEIDRPVAGVNEKGLTVVSAAASSSASDGMPESRSGGTTGCCASSVKNSSQLRSIRGSDRDQISQSMMARTSWSVANMFPRR